MTYEESSALINDMAFRGRVKVAILKYADYIFNEASNVIAHNSRYKWAVQTFQQPDMQAMLIQPPVVMDAAVQTAGAAIADPALQTAVEGVVNKMI
jgi:hypothetical protein